MKTTGRVNGIISNIVIVKADGPVGQNEICYVWTGDTKMMAEVIKVIGDAAYVQVFDSTRGRRPGRIRGSHARSHAGSGPFVAQLRRSSERPRKDGRSVHRPRFDHRSGRLRCRVGIFAAGQGRRQGHGGVVAGRGEGAVGDAQDHGPLHDDGQLYGQERRRGGQIQDHRHDGSPDRRRRPRPRGDDGAKMAREAGRALLYGETPPVAHHGDRRASDRHLQPDGRGWYGLYPGAFRRGQDRAPARHFEAGRRRRDHHGGVRRARQRGGRNLQGVPRADRPAYGPYAHGAHDHHLQHVEHACRRA